MQTKVIFYIIIVILSHYISCRFVSNLFANFKFKLSPFSILIISYFCLIIISIILIFLFLFILVVFLKIFVPSDITRFSIEKTNILKYKKLYIIIHLIVFFVSIYVYVKHPLDFLEVVVHDEEDKNKDELDELGEIDIVDEEEIEDEEETDSKENKVSVNFISKSTMIYTQTTMFISLLIAYILYRKIILLHDHASEK